MRFAREAYVTCLRYGEYYLMAAREMEGPELYYSRFDEPPILQTRTFQEIVEQEVQ